MLVMKTKIKMILINRQDNRIRALQDIQLDLEKVVNNKLVKIQRITFRILLQKKKRKKRKNRSIRKVISLTH
jgi:hypothetical protein